MKTQDKETSPKTRYPSHIVTIGIILAIIWSSIITGFFVWDRHNEIKKDSAILLYQARTFVQQLLNTRHWIARQGGVYVPVTEDLQPNPYLPMSGRDVITTDGLKLTKVNPAYFTREISEINTSDNFINFHLTSRQPLRPSNKPTPWERTTLGQFTPDKKEIYDRVTGEDGPLFRYMAPLYVKQSCLQCHAAQGYKEGDLRGGLSLSINITPILRSQHKYLREMTFTYLAIWFSSLIGIVYSFRRLYQGDCKRLRLINKLQTALKEVKALSGLLPICASCKKIRDDQGYWQQIEVFISKHSEAQFSHGICLDCAKKLYPELYGDENDLPPNSLTET